MQHNRAGRKLVVIPGVEHVSILFKPQSHQAARQWLDAAFGVGGLVLTDFGRDEPDSGYAIALQSDGKIIVAGHPGAMALAETVDRALKAAR